MSVPVVFHRLAQREVRGAFQWYAARSALAAQRFRSALDRAVERIQTHPDSLPRLGPTLQWVKVARFPFTLIFRARLLGGFLVVAVAHTSRRSNYWRGRQD